MTMGFVCLVCKDEEIRNEGQMYSHLYDEHEYSERRIEKEIAEAMKRFEKKTHA